MEYNLIPVSIKDFPMLLGEQRGKESGKKSGKEGEVEDGERMGEGNIFNQ